MTISTVKTQLNNVENDEALQSELRLALQAEQSPQAVVELAQSKGYEFSPLELKAEWKERQAQQTQDSDELSDEDLETVAGGFTWDDLGKGLLNGFVEDIGSSLGNDLLKGIGNLFDSIF